MDLGLGALQEVATLSRLMSGSERKGRPGFLGAMGKYSDWTDPLRPQEEPRHTHEKQYVKNREMMGNEKLQTDAAPFSGLKQSQEYRKGFCSSHKCTPDDRTDVISHYAHYICFIASLQHGMGSV